MTSGWGNSKARKSVEGRKLQIGGKTYERGAGTHAPSRFKIATGGNALSFSAMVGLDDEAGGKGSVVFRVLADGKVAAEVAVNGGDGAKELRADLAGAGKVVLEVTDGGDGMHFDHADWCDAYFTFRDGTRPLGAEALSRQLGILTPPARRAPRINAPARYGVRPGNPVLFKLPVAGEKPMDVKIEGALPPTLAFDSATRVVTGTLEKPGDYPIRFVAENPHGRDAKTVVFVAGEKLALTPPMGWNSWNAFAGRVSDAKIRAAADAFVRLGLDEHGYSFVNIDDFWQNNPQNGRTDPTLAGPERNPDGSISPNSRFPDMKALAGYIHSLGLKAGLYSSPGPYTCGGCTGSHLHELQDAQSYAEWGYDYLKYDWCSYGRVATGEGHIYHRRPYFLMGRCLRMQPRDIVFSLCQYGNDAVSTWGAEAGGHCWRTTGDVFDTWPSVYGAIRAQAPLWMHAAPGAWNDPDMLVLGRNVWAGGDGDAGSSRLTPNEQYTHMSMWCMLAAPLMIGCDLENIDDFTLSLLVNDEVLAIDQDELGAAAALVKNDAAGGAEIWARPLAGGAIAFALLNTDDEEHEIAFSFKEFGMRGEWLVRDVWRQKDEGAMKGGYAASVPGHATHLVRLSPLPGASLDPRLRDIRDTVYIDTAK